MAHDKELGNHSFWVILNMFKEKILSIKNSEIFGSAEKSHPCNNSRLILLKMVFMFDCTYN